MFVSIVLGSLLRPHTTSHHHHHTCQQPRLLHSCRRKRHTGAMENVH
jgi:hypothetical protein